LTHSTSHEENHEITEYRLKSIHQKKGQNRMSINIGERLRRLEKLTPEEWEKLRDKIDADTDRETEEESKKVLRQYAKLRNRPTQNE
jgi:hypothetical protein